ncbi:hypothetical protein BZA05DRAFT_386971 [Tricharina praecox]|uniref:uncharacterized protein n=1 Tax=Tricharina praecox TaxID=43433 RepID=UPI00221FBDE1|nr:uncharacterized protein BZA05DRAFT_386971 [Tricharina praecox]KAI5857003.1 hypothetical protein BZA05DRAFT_386971 [Tricharina praecox]
MTLPTTPHLRLSRSLRQLHPESVTYLPPAPFEVFQQIPADHERPESWTLLGTYKIAAQCGWLSHSRIDDDGANIFLVGTETSSTALERVGRAGEGLGEQQEQQEQQNEQPQHEQPQHDQARLQTPEAEKPDPFAAAAASERPPLPPAVDSVPVQLPPTPPPADDDLTISYTHVPLTEQAIKSLDADRRPSPAAIKLETSAVSIPQNKNKNKQENEREYDPEMPTAGSYADLCVSMSESQYSNISANDGKSDDESDRWSEISTGPVDRQWTVVFEEKDEMV